MTAPVLIAITNECGLPMGTVQAWTAACQAQDTLDLAPTWKLPPAQIICLAPGQRPPAGAWLARLLTTSDVQGALGYHTDEGLPETYVFVQTTIAAGLAPSVTLSHELCEMRVDPTTQKQNVRGSTIYAREVADPVEGDEWGYEREGVPLSDFITPSWFKPARKDAHYDFAGHLSAPYTLLRDGYMLERHKGGSWQQVFAETGNGASVRPGTSGRSNRRMQRARRV